MSWLESLLPHFSVTISWLPSPLWFTGMGTMLIIAGCAAAWFLPLGKRYGIEAAIAGVFLLFLASASDTYMERQKVEDQAKFDAYKAAQAKVVADTTVKWAEAVQQADTGAQARLTAEKERGDALEAKAQTVQHTNVVLSGALSDVLQHTRSDTGPTTADTGPNTGGKNASVAIPQPAVAEAYDEHDLAEWIVDVRKAYDSAASAWSACVNEYEGVRLSKVNGAH